MSGEATAVLVLLVKLVALHASSKQVLSYARRKVLQIYLAHRTEYQVRRLRLYLHIAPSRKRFWHARRELPPARMVGLVFVQPNHPVLQVEVLPG